MDSAHTPGTAALDPKPSFLDPDPDLSPSAAAKQHAAAAAGASSGTPVAGPKGPLLPLEQTSSVAEQHEAAAALRSRTCAAQHHEGAASPKHCAAGHPGAPP
eukprot:scaffold23876_cov23-Tisochrysis_lutea.AAC.1